MKTAYKALIELPDYKCFSRKLEKHFHKFAIILKECNKLQNAEFLKRLTLNSFQETINNMKLEEATKTYSLNHISTIYRKYLLILLLIIPFIGFSQSINLNISKYNVNPINNNGYLEMEAIDCSTLNLVNRYLETFYKQEDVLKKGVEIVRNEFPYQSKVYVVLKNGVQIERIFEFDKNVKKFRFKK